MSNYEKLNVETVQQRLEWEKLNAYRLVCDAYAEKFGIVDPEAKSSLWEKSMLPELKKLGLAEVATVAEYVQADTQDVERRMKELKSGQF